MSISGLVPVPSDALVTPVTFQVRRRALRGILAEFDKLEDGTRELSGEWVVGKKTWRRLQAEWLACRGNACGSAADRCSRSVKRKERVILYLHGGMHCFSDLLSPAPDFVIRLLWYRRILSFEPSDPQTHHDTVIEIARCTTIR